MGLAPPEVTYDQNWQSLGATLVFPINGPQFCCAYERTDWEIVAALRQQLARPFAKPGSAEQHRSIRVQRLEHSLGVTVFPPKVDALATFQGLHSQAFLRDGCLRLFPRALRRDANLMSVIKFHVDTRHDQSIRPNGRRRKHTTKEMMQMHAHNDNDLSRVVSFLCLFRVQEYICFWQVRLPCDDKSTSVVPTSTSPMHNTKCPMYITSLGCTYVIVRLRDASTTLFDGGTPVFPSASSVEAAQRPEETRVAQG